MALSASSVMTLYPTKNGVRVSFLIGDMPPHELTYEESDREAISCSIHLTGEGHDLLSGLERAALERVQALLAEKLRLVGAALRHDRARSQ